MAASYRVLDGLAIRKAADPGVGELADRLRNAIVAKTPVDTGRLAASWRVEHGRNHAVRVLSTDVPYAKFVEYGTANRPASPAVGQALASTR